MNKPNNLTEMKQWLRTVLDFLDATDTSPLIDEQKRYAEQIDLSGVAEVFAIHQPTLTTAELVDELREELGRQGGIIALLNNLDRASPSAYIHLSEIENILQGKCDPRPAVAAALGYEPVTTWRKIEPKENEEKADERH